MQVAIFSDGWRRTGTRKLARENSNQLSQVFYAARSAAEDTAI
jgi:hypothetical protein